MWRVRGIRALIRVLAPAVVLAVCAVSIALLLSSIAAGQSLFMTTPAYIVSLTIGATVPLAIGLRLIARGRQLLGFHLLAISLAVAALFFSGAAATWFVGVQRLDGVAASLLVSAFSAMRVPLLALLFSAALVAAAPLGVRLRRAWLIPLVVFTSLIGAAILFLEQQDTPFGVFAPVAGDWAATPALATIGFLLYQVWTLSLVAIPVILWLGLRTTAPPLRRDLAGIAASGTIPVVLLGVSVFLGLVAGNAIDGDLSAALAYVVSGTSCALVPIGLALATRSGTSERRGAPVAVRTVTSAALLICAVLVIVSLSVAGGLLAGEHAVIAVAVIAVVLSAVLVLLWVRFSVWLGRMTTDEPEPSSALLLGTLSLREREVLDLLARGYSNSGIARKLTLSKRTVDAHLRSIFAKLGLEPGNDLNLRVHAATAWLQTQEK